MEDEEEKEGEVIGKKIKKVGLKFQVTDVIKPLVSVTKLAEKSNLVCFGPEQGDCFVQNKETGQKIRLVPNGRGSYLLRVRFVSGGRD